MAKKMNKKTSEVLKKELNHFKIVTNRETTKENLPE